MYYFVLVHTFLNAITNVEGKVNVQKGVLKFTNKNVYVSSSPRFSSGVVIGRLIVLNGYLVH